MGLSGDNCISRINGIQANSEENCIIYGDTNGAKNTKNDKVNPAHTDLFVVKFDQFDGICTVTIKSDCLQQSEEHSVEIIGSVGGVFLVLSLCMCYYLFYKFCFLQRYNKMSAKGKWNNGLYANDQLQLALTNGANDTTSATINKGRNNNETNINEIANAITQLYNIKN